VVFYCLPKVVRPIKITASNLRKPVMICGAKLRNKDAYCQKHGMLNERCRLHGGLSPKGSDHWNFQHGWCTKESRQRSIETTARLKFLEMAAMELGMIPKKR